MADSTDLTKADGSAVSVAAQMFALIERAALDPAVDPAKMKALLDMQMDLIQYQAKREFEVAFHQMHPELPYITKKGEVRYLINKNGPSDGPTKHAFWFAKWEQVHDAITPVLHRHGFNLTHDNVNLPDGKIAVKSLLHHVAGYTREVTSPAMPHDSGGGKNAVQAAGSTSSYGQRYGTKFLLNLKFEGEDDDGVAGGGAELVSAEQVKMLSDLMIETKVNTEKYFEYLGVKGLPELEAKQFPLAYNALLRRKNLKEDKR